MYRLYLNDNVIKIIKIIYKQMFIYLEIYLSFIVPFCFSENRLFFNGLFSTPCFLYYSH